MQDIQQVSDKFNLKHLSRRERYLLALRARELREVTHLIGRGRKEILEIGGGNGWQAYLLKRKGHNVTSIDIKPRANEIAFSEVLLYDGCSLPFKDKSFDIIFSSNVLEHIHDLVNFESEMHRVLKPDGYAIHVLPTSAWRLWTSLTHPFRVLRIGYRKLKIRNHEIKNTTSPKSGQRWFYAFWPDRHGEKGNSLSEIYWFSQSAWVKHFSMCGWKVKRILNTSFAYTGNMTAHMYLPMAIRRLLARLIGSATKIYWLTSR